MSGATSAHDVDTYLESLIELERQKVVQAETPEACRDAWHSMRALIASRSLQQVVRMEKARNLRFARRAG